MGYIPKSFAIIFIVLTCGVSDITAQKITDVKYSIVYLIHGDSDYLYHAPDGQKLEADQKVLQEAKSIGKNADEGEVLIFHLLPERRILGIFPRKDRRFLHYRNGKLIRDERYSPQPDTSINPFTTETALYHRYRTNTASEEPLFRALLYFGHEIPVEQGRQYHSSQPSLLFNRDRFVRSVELFSGKRKFNLTVLSTCENGTPAMAAQLRPYTQTLLASPQNLHLSHIDTRKLWLLEQRSDIPADSLAIEMAEESFQRLSSTIQTVISLSVYQLDQMDEELTKLADQYFIFRSENNISDKSEKNIDCAQLPFFRKNQLSRGVTTYYKPPSFGSNSNTKTHSGWGCRKN